MKTNKRNRYFILLIFVIIQVQLYAAVYVKETVMIPMRDGVKLSTDIYRPNDSEQHPVILYRTPYNKDGDNLGDSGILILNFRGFVYVVQDCRGRFASQGADSTFITDGWGKLRDGYDTIDWIVQQRPSCRV